MGQLVHFALGTGDAFRTIHFDIVIARDAGHEHLAALRIDGHEHIDVAARIFAQRSVCVISGNQNRERFFGHVDLILGILYHVRPRRIVHFGINDLCAGRHECKILYIVNDAQKSVINDHRIDFPVVQGGCQIDDRGKILFRILYVILLQRFFHIRDAFRILRRAQSDRFSVQIAQARDRRSFHDPDRFRIRDLVGQIIDLGKHFIRLIYVVVSCAIDDRQDHSQNSDQDPHASASRFEHGQQKKDKREQHDDQNDRNEILHWKNVEFVDLKGEQQREDH